MVLPFFAMAFLIVDAAWGLFVKASLQHAVQEGVRYAVTGQVSGSLGQVASIKAVVTAQAMGLLSGSQSGTLSVHFLDPVSLTDLGTKPGANQGGNLVEVDISGYQFAPLAPLLRSGAAIPMNVSAADRIEGSPGGVAPPL